MDVRFGTADRAPETLGELPSGDTECIAGELAPHRVAGDRVAAVERDVGLVRPELLAVVRHVAAAVEVDRDHHRVRDEPTADEVVHGSACEQQAMGSFVHEDVEPADHRAHREEREEPDDRVVRPDRDANHADRHDVQPDDVERVPYRRDLAELVAPFRDRLAGWADAAVGGRGCEQGRVRQHRCGHAPNVTVITTNAAIT